MTINYLIFICAILSFNCKAKPNKAAPDNLILLADTATQLRKDSTNSTVDHNIAGFYLAIPDTSKGLGYKIRDKNEYYFLGTTPAVTLNEIDSVYIEFNSQIDRYTLIFKFNDVATKKWFDFTTQYNGMKVGLLLKDEIYSVATIASPISSGETVLTNAPTKKEVDDFKDIIDTEIKKAKY